MHIFGFFSYVISSATVETQTNIETADDDNDEAEQELCPELEVEDEMGLGVIEEKDVIEIDNLSGGFRNVYAISCLIFVNIAHS